MNILMLSYLFTLHWVADYIFQPREIADTKWNDIGSLTIHVFMYSFTMLLFPIICAPSFSAGFLFILWLAISHFVIDFFTSKATHLYYEQKDYSMFFIVLGADQLLHIVTFFVLLGRYIL